LTYLADGWARQRESVAPPITVFELALHYVEVPGSQGPTPARGRLTPLTVRVVVDETTGDATLTRRGDRAGSLRPPRVLPPEPRFVARTTPVTHPKQYQHSRKFEEVCVAIGHVPL
jgi:hypothetical protein